MTRRRAKRQQTEALDALSAEVKRQSDFATSAAAIQSGAMARWVADVVSRQIGTRAPAHGAAVRRPEPLADFFTGVCFGAAVVVLFWTLFGR